MNKLLCGTLTSFFILVALPALGADFKVTAPRTWQKAEFKIDSNFDGAIYKNSQSSRNEIVVIEAFPTETNNSEFHENLPNYKSKIESARASFYATFGLSHFTLHSIEKRKITSGGFDYIQEVQSSFLDLQNREVQMFERQYQKRDRMYVVTYLIDAPALNDRTRVQWVLDGFQPIAQSSRMPASAMETIQSRRGAGPALADDTSETAPAVNDLDMNLPANQKLCENVPKEKRRTPYDPSFLGGLKNQLKDTWGVGKGCVTGVVGSALDFVKGTLDSALATGKFAVKYGWSWVAGTDYKDQVHASVGAVIAEIKKDPADLAKKLTMALASAMSNYAHDFFLCYNAETQMHAICALATQLNPRLMMMMLTKAPMAITEIAELAKAVNGAVAAVGTEEKIANVAARAATALSDVHAEPVAKAAGAASNVRAGKVLKPGFDYFGNPSEAKVGSELFQKLVKTSTRTDEIDSELAKLTDENLGYLLTNRNVVVRNHALLELENRSPEFAAKFLGPENSDEVRRLAVEVAGRSPGPEVRAGLAIALKDARPDIRFSALKSISRITDEESARLSATLVNDPVAEIRELAEVRVQQFHAEEAVRARYRKLTLDQFSDVFMNHAKDESISAVPAILERDPAFQSAMLKMSTDIDVRTEMAQAIMARSPPIKLAKQILSDESKLVRASGINSANLQDPEIFKLVEQIADNDKNPVVRDLAQQQVALATSMKLPRGNDMKALQANRLLNLRYLKETEGRFRNLQQQREYEVLEIRNREIGLITDDIDGQAFAESLGKILQGSIREKRDWIEKFGYSHHPEADQTIAQALYGKGLDTGLQLKVMETALQRGQKIDYEKIDPSYFHSLKGQLSMDSGGAQIVDLELRNLPEKALQKFLEDPDLKISRSSVLGLNGRSPEFISQFVKHPDPQIRISAIHYLDGHFDDLTKSVLRAQLNDKDDEVAKAAAEALGRFRDVQLDPIVNARLQNVPGAIRAQSVSFNTFFTNETLEKITTGQSANVGEYVQRLKYLPQDVSIKALANTNDAEVRLKVASQLLEMPVFRDAPTISRLLNDPVEEIRKVGIQILAREPGQSENRLRLIEAFRNDESFKVRAEAKAALDSIQGGMSTETASRGVFLARQKADVATRYGVKNVADKDIPLLLLSRHVYEAGEFTKGQSAADLVAEQLKFKANTPMGFEIIDQMGGPEAGFKAAFYKNVSGGVTEPLVVAIAGTQTWTDVATDINMGVAQAKSLAYGKMLERAATEIIATGKNLEVTGHSLGANQAQVFGHDVIKVLADRGVKDASQRVRVVSWNGFGAVETLKRLDRFDPAVAKIMTATNYFLPNEPVHKIGTHIGIMRELPRAETGSQISNHKAEALVDSTIFKNGMLKAVTTVTPGKIPGSVLISALAGPLTDELQHLQFMTFKAKKVVQTYIDARLKYAADEEYKTLHSDYDWLQVDIQDAIATSGRNKAALQKLLGDAEAARLKILAERRSVVPALQLSGN